MGCCSAPHPRKAVEGTSCPGWVGCQLRGVPGCPQSQGALLGSLFSPCPGATKCTYPGAALLPARVGAQPCCTPQPARGCTAAPHGTGTVGAAEGVPVKGSPVSPPLTPARTPPPCSDAPPPWQRCTPSSRALTPRETLRQMVLTPAPCPGCSLFAHGGLGDAGWGGWGRSPGTFHSWCPSIHPPVHPTATSGPGPREPEQLRLRPTPINAL